MAKPTKHNSQQHSCWRAGLIAIATHFGITVDEIIYFGDKDGIPKEITLEDKTATEQARLIAELDDKNKTVVLSMIETMLIKKIQRLLW